jgi:hypothetical protein
MDKYKTKQGNLTLKGRLSTVFVVLMDTVCFVKGKLYISVLKAANLNYLVQGGQLYPSFPSSKSSLVLGTFLLITIVAGFIVVVLA